MNLLFYKIHFNYISSQLISSSLIFFVSLFILRSVSYRIYFLIQRKSLVFDRAISKTQAYYSLDIFDLSRNFLPNLRMNIFPSFMSIQHPHDVCPKKLGYYFYVIRAFCVIYTRLVVLSTVYLFYLQLATFK